MFVMYLEQLIIQFCKTWQEVDDEMRKHIETLKEEVRKMLVPTTEKPLTKVKLIDSIQRLGLCYHFEREIHEILNHIHNNYVENGQIMHSAFQDLHSLALLFRLLRQQGYHISPGIYILLYITTKYSTSNLLLLSQLNLG